MLPKNIVTIKLQEFRSFICAGRFLYIGTPEKYANQKNDYFTYLRFFARHLYHKDIKLFALFILSSWMALIKNVQNEKQKSLKFCQTFIICSY